MARYQSCRPRGREHREERRRKCPASRRVGSHRFDQRTQEKKAADRDERWDHIARRGPWQKPRCIGEEVISNPLVKVELVIDREQNEDERNERPQPCDAASEPAANEEHTGEKRGEHQGRALDPGHRVLLVGDVAAVVRQSRYEEADRDGQRPRRKGDHEQPAEDDEPTNSPLGFPGGGDRHRRECLARRVPRPLALRCAHVAQGVFGGTVPQSGRSGGGVVSGLGAGAGTGAGGGAGGASAAVSAAAAASPFLDPASLPAAAPRSSPAVRPSFSPRCLEEANASCSADSRAASKASWRALAASLPDGAVDSPRRYPPTASATATTPAATTAARRASSRFISPNES